MLYSVWEYKIGSWSQFYIVTCMSYLFIAETQQYLKCIRTKGYLRIMHKLNISSLYLLVAIVCNDGYNLLNILHLKDLDQKWQLHWSVSGYRALCPYINISCCWVNWRGRDGFDRVYCYDNDACISTSKTNTFII